MSLGAAETAFRLTYEISPVIFSGGIADSIPGGMLPTLSITDATSFAGLLGGGNFNIESAFARWMPLPGSTLIAQQIGMYPFANQQTAANATIAQPLTIDMLMLCPAQPGGGYVSKLAILSSLQAAVKSHNSSGGVYTVMTPGFIWDNCVMLDITDVSSSMTKQVQTAWKWSFIKPLISLAEAAAAQNSMMTALTNGTPTDGSLTGTGPTVGQQPSIATPSVAPAASSIGGSNISGLFS